MHAISETAKNIIEDDRGGTSWYMYSRKCRVCAVAGTVVFVPETAADIHRYGFKNKQVWKNAGYNSLWLAGGYGAGRGLQSFYKYSQPPKWYQYVKMHTLAR